MILASSAGLGTYVPAVRLWSSLRASLPEIRLDLLEHLYTPDHLDRVVQGRRRCQQDFSYALMTQRVLQLGSSTNGLSQERLGDLFSHWRRTQEKNFIVFSGFWLPILKLFCEGAHTPLLIDAVQMDATLAHSWRRHLPDFSPEVRLQWLYPAEEKLPWSLLDEAGCSPAPTSRRLLLHGGGWQIGDHTNYASTLSKQNFSIIMGVQSQKDALHSVEVDTFNTSSHWEPWTATNPTDLPLHVVHNGVETFVPDGIDWFRHRVCEALAIVAKPGGATLLDSLSTATPVIFTRPYGLVEEANAALWCAKGFGLLFSDWEKIGFSIEPLQEMTTSLDRARQTLPIFSRVLTGKEVSSRL